MPGRECFCSPAIRRASVRKLPQSCWECPKRARPRITLLGDPDVFAAGAKLAGVAAFHLLGTLRATCEHIRAGETDAFLFASLNEQAMKLAGHREGR
jgi:hypothetical protein